ncbi:type I-E CRISPR-associated protein Cas6/Cse3/CasE [Streptomyces olivoreticuli]
MSTTATLARIELNLQSRAVQRDLRDPTQMHRTLMRLIPNHLGDNPRHSTGLLYRLDETEHASTLLAQAAVPAVLLDPARLPDGYGRPHIKSLAPMFTALRKGLPVRYRITVSPTKCERHPTPGDRGRGKITPLTGPAADEWWTRRATDAGLQLTTVLPTPQRPVSRHGKETGTVRHCLIRYDGTATITDPTALTNALLAGIGRGKPYGAGLLSLAPAHTP